MSSHHGPKKSYAPHVAVMLGSAILVGIFTAWLVTHHHAVPDRVRAIHDENASRVVNCCAE